jgi:hypothetical protein
MVAQTANQIVSEQFLPGYTYYEEYGMYYNSQDGYFYDPVIKFQIKICDMLILEILPLLPSNHSMLL